MAHNGSLVPWPDTLPQGDDVALVLGWLQRCTPDRSRTEDLTVEVFRRRARPGPAWLARAPADVRLRFAVAMTVLRARGTL